MSAPNELLKSQGASKCGWMWSYKSQTTMLQHTSHSKFHVGSIDKEIFSASPHACNSCSGHKVAARGHAQPLNGARVRPQAMQPGKTRWVVRFLRSFNRVRGRGNAHRSSERAGHLWRKTIRGSEARACARCLPSARGSVRGERVRRLKSGWNV